jgi:hypothetical protein
MKIIPNDAPSRNNILPSSAVRDFWETESRLQGTDWPGLLSAHAEMLHRARLTHCSSYRESDWGQRVEAIAAENKSNETPKIKQLRALMDDSVSLDAAWRVLNGDRPTPRTTIEAIMYCVRERGLAALGEPKNQQRLSESDEAARAEINQRIAKLYGAKP